MKAFFTIFSKELKDTLRDRRTLLAMIVVPFCLIPLILSITTWITASQSDKAMEKQLRVALVDNDNGGALLRRMRLRNDMTLYNNIAESDFNALIRKDSIDMGMVIADDFDANIANGATGAIDIFYDATGCSSTELMSFIAPPLLSIDHRIGAVKSQAKALCNAFVAMISQRHSAVGLDSRRKRGQEKREREFLPKFL